MRERAIAHSTKHRNGIVVFVGDGKIQNAVGVEVRHDDGAGIGSHRDGRAWRFAESAVGNAGGGVYIGEQDGNIVRSGIHQEDVGGLRGREFSAVRAKDSRADGYLSGFIRAQGNRRRRYWNEIAIVLIFQNGERIGGRIVEYHREVGQGAAGKASRNQRRRIIPDHKIGFWKSGRAGSPSKSPAGAQTGGEQRQRDGEAVADKERSRLSILGAQ